MSAGGPTRAEIPPDTRPSALLLGGLRRGAVQIFLPVALAGQALAWTAYAITGAYRPWSWLKIGLAYALASVRVPFLITPTDPSGTGPTVERMLVALGALSVAVVVLAFRSGRAQAVGLEARPISAALAGSVVGLGFAVPSLLIALPIRLAFPSATVALLRPEIVAAFVLPLVVAGSVGAVGGLARARADLEGSVWGKRLVEAVHGGFTALWWGLGLAVLGFLVLAAVQTGATRAYGRSIGEAGSGGAVAVVHHALLLPNQSAMILAASMGSPVELVAGDQGATIGLAGIDRVGDGILFFGSVGPDEGHVDLPVWYLAFAVVPLVGTIAGGRRAGEGAGPPRERALVGALAGIVYAALITVTAWAATLVVPILTPFFGGPTRLGPDLGRVAVLSLVWGIAGCVAGALLSPSRPR